MTYRAGLIYKITNKINDNAYIGQTVKTRAKRWAEHLRAVRNGSKLALHCAIRKYGAENFTIRVLKRVTEPLLNAAEKHFVARHDTYRHGYNMTPGGDGYTLSDAILRKISKANTGKVRTAEMLRNGSKAQIARFSKKSERHKMSLNKLDQYAARPGIKTRLSASLTMLWQDQEYRAMMIEARKARWANPAEIKKLSDAHKGKLWSAKRRAAYEASIV